MPGVIPLFERGEDGLLRQVPPDKADASRAGRRASRVSMVADVLWTADAEAARDAEEAASAAAPARVTTLTAEEKLARMGLSVDELRGLLRG